jgi:hypothetical protein
VRGIRRINNPNSHCGTSYTLAYDFSTAVCIQETLGDEGYSTILVFKMFDFSSLRTSCLESNACLGALQARRECNCFGLLLREERFDIPSSLCRQFDAMSHAAPDAWSHRKRSTARKPFLRYRCKAFRVMCHERCANAHLEKSILTCPSSKTRSFPIPAEKFLICGSRGSLPLRGLQMS